MKVYLDALSRGSTISIGTQALIIGSMEIISKYFKNVEFIMLSSFPDIDKAFLDKETYKVKLVKRSDSQIGTVKDIRRIVKEVDCVVSAWGDGYITIPPHKIFQKTFFLKHPNKPLVLFPSSMGPFSGTFKKYMSYLGLNQFDYIMARDTLTFDYLKDLGFQNSRLVPDTAFILDPINIQMVKKLFEIENIRENKQHIGLNVSQLLNYLFNTKLKINYTQFMVKLIYYINNRFDRHVLLVPHQIVPDVYQKKNVGSIHDRRGDDRIAIRRIMKSLGDNASVSPLLSEYSCRELKGIIGSCEIFIGGRMHSVIGALSMGVPSILMQYSHKAFGVMDLLGLKRFVWDIDSPSNKLFSIMNSIWQDRTTLRQQINNNMIKVKKDAWKAGEILERALRNCTY